MSEQNNNKLKGNPTKKFFVEMITRDISIEDAIIDLLDNSIDGATKINASDYNGRLVDITVNKDSFVISDNCGGFSLDIAKDYAFRFGRPDNAPKTHNTVGRFGIGMKRSLFKIGKRFSIESETLNDHFKVVVDVEEWSCKSKNVTIEGSIDSIEDWDFDYVDVQESMGYQGTKIVIEQLNPEVIDLFSDNDFLYELKNDISKFLNFSFQKGMKIILNGEELSGNKIMLLACDDYKPFYVDGQIKDVKYRVIAGLGEVGEPKRSGWYIFCNDRLVLEADTSSLTGWGTAPVKQWHTEYVMFRGLVFFDSEETLDLPLTTTKKGIDFSSEIYQSVLPLMKNGIMSVIAFLNKIKAMKDQANDYRMMLGEKFGTISALSLKNTVFVDHKPMSFVEPELDLEIISQKRESVRIAYDANKKIAMAAKINAQVSSFKELGITTFDYYLSQEGIKDDNV